MQQKVGSKWLNPGNTTTLIIPKDSHITGVPLYTRTTTNVGW